MNDNLLNEILAYTETNYSVLTKIVESGQRVVYRAKDVRSDVSTFVLKTSPIFPESVARIQRELKILEDINSVNFPKSVFSQFISLEQIQYFIDNFDPKTESEKINYLKSLKLKPFFITVEEYVEHSKWGAHVEFFRSNEKEFASFLKKIFQALNILWEKKIVHRDLKPDNILIRPNLDPVIIDLGIAKSMREGTEAITHIFGHSPCTPQFAAPEQIMNNKAEVTYKSDQFSMGVIAYWVLTDKFPFGAIGEIGPEAFLRNLSENKVVNTKTINPNVSDNLDKFVMRLIGIQPFQRFRNYQDIESSLNLIGELK